jgi:bleomycin hydrolase
MKHLFNTTLMILAFAFVTANSFAQEEDNQEKTGYDFEVTTEIDHTPVRNQYRSGTCWSFSALGFIEAELIRMGKGEYDLSEMFVVRKVYKDKAEKHVRMHGHFNFGGGGALNDVTDVIKKYGIVPEKAYPGLEYGEEKHVHGELDKVLSEFLDGIIQNKNKKLTPAWKEAYLGILDAYLGENPSEFKYKGKTYTPRAFADEYLGINADDYILLTSYTHHPFYKPFILEVPDNWSWAKLYNVPIADLIDIMDNSVKKGYTISWASDVSEKGFSWSNGLAIVPTKKVEELDGLEKDKWEKLTKKEQQKQLYNFDEPGDEIEVTQEMRQEAFNNYQTTDDHAMLIVGTAKDQKGNEYYKVKNSWGTGGHIYNGYFYASKPFVKYKTMSIMVHKDVVPGNIAEKLGL